MVGPGEQPGEPDGTKRADGEVEELLAAAREGRDQATPGLDSPFRPAVEKKVVATLTGEELEAARRNTAYSC